MIRAGEASGALGVLLDRLAEYLERMRALRDAIISALIYPAILLTVAGASVVVLLTLVLPRFAALFADSGMPLPLLTQVVLGFGEFMTRYGVLVLGVAAGAIVFARQHYASAAGRQFWDSRLLRAPLVGPLITRLEVARFCRTLGTLLGNGVPLLGALAIARQVLGNMVLAAAIDAAEGQLREGAGLAQPLLARRVFPRHALHMMRVGEETGDLPAMLNRIGDVYEVEVKTAVMRLLAILEPVLIVGLGMLVAVIVLSLLVAILAVNDLPV
jgi:general secretion pathway protein F